MIVAIGKRLAIGVFVVWGAVSLIFVLLRLAPGDPALLFLGPGAAPEEVAALSAKLGLDRSPFAQYLSYLGQVIQLDFGRSFRFDMPAMDVVFSRLTATIQLTLGATAIAVVVGLSAGMIAARRPNGVVDRVISGGIILFQSMPTFWVGIMLILIFALAFRALPSSGSGTLAHLVLPSVALSLPFISIVGRITRASLTETMREQFIQTAFAKGLTRSEVVRSHALRNSLAPVVTIVGLQIGALLGGAVVVENVFAWPGLGSLIVSSVANRDYAVVQAAVLLIAVIVLFLNLVADISYSILDPRVRRKVSA